MVKEADEDERDASDEDELFEIKDDEATSDETLDDEYDLTSEGIKSALDLKLTFLLFLFDATG